MTLQEFCNKFAIELFKGMIPIFIILFIITIVVVLFKKIIKKDRF